MCFQFFANVVDRTGEEVLVERFRIKMFGSGKKKWHVQRIKKQKNGTKKAGCWKKKKRTVRLLKQHRELLLNELDVNKVLPYLLFKKVFSLHEYTEIQGQESNRKQAELFLDQIVDKGPDGFYSFCSVLEEVSPHLLTCFLLGHEGALVYLYHDIRYQIMTAQTFNGCKYNGQKKHTNIIPKVIKIHRFFTFKN